MTPTEQRIGLLKVRTAALLWNWRATRNSAYLDRAMRSLHHACQLNQRQRSKSCAA